MSTFKYFSGTEQVFNAINLGTATKPEGAKFIKRMGYVIGFPLETSSHDIFNRIGAKPVTRVIEYKSNPSLHKCDARCRHAKGNSCECSCGGQFHGAGD